MDTLHLFVAHGSRPAAGASARALQERRAAVAACREPVKDGLALVGHPCATRANGALSAACAGALIG